SCSRDWSSDVCSSDPRLIGGRIAHHQAKETVTAPTSTPHLALDLAFDRNPSAFPALNPHQQPLHAIDQRPRFDWICRTNLRRHFLLEALEMIHRLTKVSAFEGRTSRVQAGDK